MVSAVPLPQAFVPETIIVPEPVPIVTVRVPVVLAPDQPVPETDHVKLVAPVDVAV
jgi:hypothetical protein